MKFYINWEMHFFPDASSNRNKKQLVSYLSMTFPTLLICRDVSLTSKSETYLTQCTQWVQVWVKIITRRCNLSSTQSFAGFSTPKRKDLNT
jgi:hypothetical protein